MSLAYFWETLIEKRVAGDYSDTLSSVSSAQNRNRATKVILTVCGLRVFFVFFLLIKRKSIMASRISNIEMEYITSQLLR